MIATNSDAMKRRNKRLILSLILKGEFSRVDLSNKTNLTKAAVTIIVDELINEGLVYEAQLLKTRSGRYPRLLKIKEGSIKAIGINITRNYVTLGLCDILGNIYFEESFPILSKNETIKKIISVIKDKEKENPDIFLNTIGIGVCSPGPVDTLNCTILNPPNFDTWHYENIGLRLSGSFNHKIFLQNVSSSVALCEKYFSKKEDNDNFMSLIVNEGIGASFILNSTLFKNPTELGHTSICYNGPKCRCGSYGCAENYASIPAILNGTKYKNWSEVIEANDTLIIDKEAMYLSTLINNALNMFSLDKVVLEGDINTSCDTLIDKIKQNLENKTLYKRSVKIEKGSKTSGVLCGAVTVFDDFLTSADFSK